MENQNKLQWGKHSFSPRPFTLGRLFDLWEMTTTSAKDSAIFRNLFESRCSILLRGDTDAAQKYLDSGELAKDILESEDAVLAFEFKETVEFFSDSFNKQAEKLKESAPDLRDKLQAKMSQLFSPNSPQATSTGPEHSV